MVDGYISFDYVVSSYLNESGKYNLDDYARFLAVVKEGYTNLNITHHISFKVTTGTVNDINVFPLPSDYLDWKLIGLIDQNDMVMPVMENNDIPLSREILCGEDQGYPKHSNSIYSRSNMFGSPAGQPFVEARIDKLLRRIIFRGDILSETIYLEYVSSGIGDGPDTLIPVELLPVLKAYLRWTIAKATDEAESKIDRKKRDYGFELKRYLVSSQVPLTYSMILNSLRKGYKQTPKR